MASGTLLLLCSYIFTMQGRGLHVSSGGPTRRVSGGLALSAAQVSVASVSSSQSELLEETVGALWAGSDEMQPAGWTALKEHLDSVVKTGGVTLHQDNLTQPDDANSAPLRPWGLAPLQILGMFDSGTNLFGATLEANIGYDQMALVCPGAAWGLEGYHCHFPKHTPPSALVSYLSKEHHDQKVSGDFVIVALVRSPLAQIEGWEKAAYDLRSSCLQPWRIEEQEKMDCNISFEDHKVERFSGLTGLWNAYTQAYDALRSRHTGKVFIVEYEQLVLKPEPIIQEVAAALGTKLMGPFRTIQAPAKKHGLSRGRQDALARLIGMDYMIPMKPWSIGDLLAQKLLCSHLSSDTMNLHVVPTHPPRTYAADCGNTSNLHQWL